MKNFPQKITQENFNDAANSVLFAKASIERNGKTKKIVRPLGNILFVFFSFLFVYGSIYKNVSAEEVIVFEKLTPLTKIWSFFADILTKPDMKWYVFAVVLLAAAFVIPLLVSAIVKIIVSLTNKINSTQFFDGSTAANAKKLHVLAAEVYKKSSNYESDCSKTPYKLAFVLLVAAFLIYAFVILKMIMGLALFGFVIAMLLLYWVYGLLFNLFVTLNKLFYKKVRIPNVTSVTEQFWLSVDPEEANRRKAEADRKAKEKKKQQKATRQSAATYTSTETKTIDKYDSFTWTDEYVRNNESECSNVALSVLKVSKELLAEGDYSGAAAGFDKVVRALELLKNIDSEYYLPPLFANCYALCKIFAFGLNNKNVACEYAKKACDYASRCNSQTAQRDLVIMRDFYDALSSSSSLSSLADEFDIDFPNDVLSMG